MLTDNVGPVDIEVPRDREAIFDPGHRQEAAGRLGGSTQSCCRCRQGLTTGDVSAHFEEIYGGVAVQRHHLQDHQPGAHRDDRADGPAAGEGLPAVFIDAIYVKIRNGQVANRPCYAVLRGPAGRGVLSLRAGSHAQCHTMVRAGMPSPNGELMTTTSDAALRGVLRDAFLRVRDEVQHLCSVVSAEQATYRPDPDGNSISWLVWHLTRIQDDHICGLSGEEQAWTRDGWYDRFGLPFNPEVHGYGHGSAEVAVVQVAPPLLAGYHKAVNEMTMRYVDAVTAAELARIVDRSWDPPVTAGVRLVSVIGDALAHLGQADYVRGLAERAGVPGNADS